MKYRFASEIEKVSLRPASEGLTFYKDGQLATRNSIALKKT